MQLTDFDFPFDLELIALQPAVPRDAARLMVVPRQGGPYQHRQILELPTVLQRNDVLVVNDTRVLPARLVGRKQPGGGQVELLFVKEREEGVWDVLVSRRVQAGQVIQVDGDTAVTVLRNGTQTVVRIVGPRAVRRLLDEKGQMPLPPYIKRDPVDDDRVWYQTIFAKRLGAVAAPTAGLHFTDRLLAALRERGVTTVSVTLHVGPGTFLPVRSMEIEQHTMLEESFQISKETVETLEHARAAGNRIVAVGTTVVRALESAVGADGRLAAMKGETSLYITPGYRFRVVNGLLTNFHFPRSTLLMLVTAMTGLERMRDAYTEALRHRYRLYSYGDAMLIL
jgi:S-adenosylmethionine:tRNA ribosyltransferase-isomerase